MSSELVDKAKKELTGQESSVLQQKLDDLISQRDLALSSHHNFNSPHFGQLSKELEKVQRKLALVLNLEKLLNRLNETQKLLSDSEFSDIAKEEIEQIEAEITTDLEELETLNLVKLENDDLRAIMEIRPGVGGIEAALFAENLLKAYMAYFSREKIATEVYTVDYNLEGGINLAIIFIDESGSFGTLRFESGVHRVQRVPTTEAMGRIHTSTASIVVMPKYEEVDIKIEAADLRIDVYRSTGPGGQSVNTTDSAVRITHLPSKITVTCQSSKSQHKNKEFAMAVLKSRLYEIELEKKSAKEKSLRQSSIQGGDRSAKIRTYNFPQSRVTDHRINKNWFNINEIMEGEIGVVAKEVSLELRKTLK